MGPDPVELGVSYSPETMQAPSVPTLEQFIALIKTRNLARTERFFAHFNLPEGIASSNSIKDLSLLCEEAALPAKIMETRRLRINGMDEFRAHTVNYGEEITLQFLIDSDWTPRKLMEAWMLKCVSPVSKGREVGFYDDYKADIGLFALIPAGMPGSKIASYSPTQNDIGLTQALYNFTDGVPGSRTAVDRLMMRGRKTIDKLTAKAKSQTIGRLNLASNPLIELFRDTETVAFSVTLKECFPKSINVMPLSYANPGVHRMNVTFNYKYWESEVSAAASMEEDALNSFNNLINERLRKYTDKIPSGKLSGLGSDLRDKFSSFGRRLGG